MSKYKEIAAQAGDALKKYWGNLSGQTVRRMVRAADSGEYLGHKLPKGLHTIDLEYILPKRPRRVFENTRIINAAKKVRNTTRAATAAGIASVGVGGVALQQHKKNRENTMKAPVIITKEAKDEYGNNWFDRQMGVTRASRMSDSGLGKIVAKPELIKKRFIGGAKGIGIGALGGAAIGAGVGALSKNTLLGTLMGIGAGALTGEVAGISRADNRYLKDRGIRTTRLGFDYSYTPEASQKYIQAYKKRNK